MNAEDVAGYLKSHPEFFEQYAEMMADITIPHPHGGRTIPISERQILTLREKGKQLESKLREIIQFGEENDAHGEKMHALTLDLLRATDAASVVQITLRHLREHFVVPHVALRLWHAEAGDQAGVQTASQATRQYAMTLTEPACGAEPAADTLILFGEAAAGLQAFAYVPLRGGDTIGLLALASEEARRYYTGMGTLYLSRLGDVVGCALATHLA